MQKFNSHNIGGRTMTPDANTSRLKGWLHSSRTLCLTGFFASLACSVIAHASTTVTPKPGMTTSKARITQNDATPTRIVIDPRSNTIRFIISGKEVGLFDKSGLHVDGDVTYTGVITDTGTANGDGRAK
jgi:hypothetical protein